MRYYLEQQDHGHPHTEVFGQRKKTRAEVDAWVNQNIAACGLDWRVGYTMKFKNSGTVYVWRKLKDQSSLG